MAMSMVIANIIQAMANIIQAMAMSMVIANIIQPIAMAIANIFHKLIK